MKLTLTFATALIAAALPLGLAPPSASADALDCIEGSNTYDGYPDRRVPALLRVTENAQAVSEGAADSTTEAVVQAYGLYKGDTVRLKVREGTSWATVKTWKISGPTNLLRRVERDNGSDLRVDLARPSRTEPSCARVTRSAVLKGLATDPTPPTAAPDAYRGGKHCSATYQDQDVRKPAMRRLSHAGYKNRYGGTGSIMLAVQAYGLYKGDKVTLQRRVGTGPWHPLVIWRPASAANLHKISEGPERGKYRLVIARPAAGNCTAIYRSNVVTP